MDMANWFAPLPDWTVTVIVAVAALIAGWIFHIAAFALLHRLSRRTEIAGDNILVERSRRPSLALILFMILAIVLRARGVDGPAAGWWDIASGLALPALLAWLLIALLRASYAIVEVRSDISVDDNLDARRRRTRVGIFVRIGIFVVIFITTGLMLLNIPGVRSVGLSLLASAGIAGLAIGAAAQPALKNVIAGMQLAFTEPIRIDDAVFIENEWGWIEEIRLTYVVVKLWDERRLIVPVSRVLEQSFQNWTYKRADMLGSIFLWLDPMADIDRLRAHFEKVVKAEPLFNGKAQVLQVTDSKPDAIEIRMLATADTSPKAWDLRCAIREKMLAFLRDQMPNALPRTRLLHVAAEGPEERPADT